MKRITLAFQCAIVFAALGTGAALAQSSSPGVDLTAGGLVSYDLLTQGQRRLESARIILGDAQEKKLRAEAKLKETQGEHEKARRGADRLQKALDTDLKFLVDALLTAEEALADAETALRAAPIGDAAAVKAVEDADKQVKEARKAFVNFVKDLNVDLVVEIDPNANSLLARAAFQTALDLQRKHIGALTDAVAVATTRVAEANAYAAGAAAEYAASEQYIKDVLPLVGQLDISRRVDELRAKVETLSANVVDIKSNQAATTAAVVGLRSDVAGLRSDVQTVTKEVKDMSRLVEAQSAEIKKLASEISDMKFSKSKAEEIAALLNRMESKMYTLATAAQAVEVTSILRDLKAKADTSRVIHTVAYPTYQVVWGCPSGPYGCRWYPRWCN